MQTSAIRSVTAASPDSSTPETRHAYPPGTGQPLYFGPADRPLFGHLHAPADTTSASIGLVLCNPFGNEAICAHRSIRHLAERSARRGISTLRFDYEGTGDSCGDATDPNRVDQWIADIRAAADELRRSTGVDRICFAGIRLGALLATLAARDYVQRAGLIAIAPVVSGKAYVRELRLLRRSIESKRNIERNDQAGILESAGFVLSESTQAALTAIDLLKQDINDPRIPVLLLDRAELPAGEKWLGRLRELDVEVEYAQVRGYTEMMLDSHETIVPEEILGAALDWLSRLEAARPRQVWPRVTSALKSASTPQVRRLESIEETAGYFGEDTRLFGVITAPAGDAIKEPRKAVLLLNSGAVTHVGPCRVYVTLARALAKLGYIVLRLDISGIGDSPTRPQAIENVVYPPYAMQDIAVALDYLQQTWAVSEIQAAGICSGAYHAFKAAVANMGLRRAIMINPLTFFWKEGMSLEFPEHRVSQDIQRYRHNVWNLASWQKLISGKANIGEMAQVLQRGARARLAVPLRNAARWLRMPFPDDLPTELLQATGAGIDLHFIFAANDPGLELLRQKGNSTLQRLRTRGLIGIEVIPDADHTFTDLSTRQALVTAVVQKIRS
ncbi:MAG TPA: alpha/beta fold hydrolase [Steroidobacteraceae bacterium]